MNQKRKKLIREKRRQCMLNIMQSQTFAEALQYKEMLEADGGTIDVDIYYELLFKCIDYVALCELKAEMERIDCIFDERIYICLIKKTPSFAVKMELLSEMIIKEIKPSIKTYFVLIRDAKIEQALALVAEMGKQNIKPDLRIYKELVRLAQGTEYYQPLKKELDNAEQLESLISHARSYEYVNFAIRKAKAWGLSYNIDTFNDMFLSVEKPEDMLRLFDQIRQEKLAYSYRTYVNFLRAYLAKGDANKIKGYLKEIEAGLSVSEIANLLAFYKQQAIVHGGLAKVTKKCYQLVNEIQKDLEQETDFAEQVYKNGIIAGLDADSIEFQILTSNAIAEIAVMEEAQVGEELFTYNILFEKGKIEGIKRKSSVYDEVKRQGLPILIICYVAEEALLLRIRKYALEHYFFEYELDNLGKYNINGFLFTTDINEFTRAARNADSVTHDIAYNLIGTEQEISAFTEEASGVLEYLYQTRSQNFNHLDFRSLKSNKDVNIKALFYQLFKGANLRCYPKITEERAEGVGC